MTEKLMEEAFEQAHQLTLKHWKTALFLPPPPLIEQPGVAVEELMEGGQAPARQDDQELQIAQHSRRHVLHSFRQPRLVLNRPTMIALEGTSATDVLANMSAIYFPTR